MKNITSRIPVKRLLLSLALAGCLIPAAQAQVGINVIIGTPPPPPRMESVPPHRAGMVWIPGFWGWDGRRHVWADGHWESVRSGYAYERPVWVQADSGWRLREGGWKRNKHDKHRGDHDGRDHRDGHDDHDDRGRGGHCPPGQAKKGNC